MKKLLILEDDETFAVGLMRALSRRSYSCVLATTIAEARGMIRDFKPECVLMDLNLGTENTQGFIGELRKMLPHSVIVMLTGFGTIPSAVQAVKDGADAYLTKPVIPDILDKTFQEHEKVLVNEKPLWNLENDHILKVLSECGGNISQASKKLGLHRRTLQRRLKKT